MKKEQTNESRRDFLKKSAYVAPAIATMAVAPTVHAVGSASSQPTPVPPPIDQR